MAPTTSPEASEIRRKGRQRLIGAIAIAVLLVVFVPMILDSEQRPARTGPSLDIPPKDKAAPLPPPSAPLIPHKPLPPVTPAAVPAKAAEPVVPAKAATQPEPGKVPAKPAAASTPTPKLEGFAVQVGAFKDEEKLKQVREKLVNAGVPFYVERHDTPAGELKRVRAGPFATREAAEAGLAKIKLGALDGQVVALP